MFGLSSFSNRWWCDMIQCSMSWKKVMWMIWVLWSCVKLLLVIDWSDHYSNQTADLTTKMANLWPTSGLHMHFGFSKQSSNHSGGGTEPGNPSYHSEWSKSFTWRMIFLCSFPFNFFFMKVDMCKWNFGKQNHR